MKAVVFAYSNVGDRCLRVLAAGGVELPLVVTHRDHPGETLWFARVADTAAELGLPVAYVDDLAPDALVAAVRAAAPDAIFSFYFRNLLPAAILDLAPGRAFNLHGSLLPQFRGRAPTNWAVLHGAMQTGATLHEMTIKADAGAIVEQVAVPILPDDTGREVFDKVSVAAEIALWRALPSIVAGTHPRLPNEIARGSYHGRRTPEDGRIDWSRPAAEVYNLIRAVAPPYPGAFTEVAGRRLVVAAARRLAAGGGSPASSGIGLQVVGGRMVGSCGDGGLIDIHELRDGETVLDASTLEPLLHNQGAPA